MTQKLWALVNKQRHPQLLQWVCRWKELMYVQGNAVELCPQNPFSSWLDLFCPIFHWKMCLLLKFVESSLFFRESMSECSCSVVCFTWNGKYVKLTSDPCEYWLSMCSGLRTSQTTRSLQLMVSEELLL